MNDYEEVGYDYTEQVVHRLRELADKNSEVEYDNEIEFTDKKSRLMVQALEALESTGGLDFAVLKYPELGEVWGKYFAMREHRRKKAVAMKKLESTMSKEELKLLGLGHLLK